MTDVEIELVGGPQDGRVIRTSKPTQWLHMPVPVPSPSCNPADPTTVPYESFKQLVYHRCVISDVTHRWRYVLGSHDPCRA